jgi:hypothetical protein
VVVPNSAIWGAVIVNENAKPDETTKLLRDDPRPEWGRRGSARASDPAQ